MRESALRQGQSRHGWSGQVMDSLAGAPLNAAANSSRTPPSQPRASLRSVGRRAVLIWTKEQLIEMNARFAAALEQAFACGLESRASAAGQIKLKPSLGPRWATPLTREIQEALWGASVPSVLPRPSRSKYVGQSKLLANDGLHAARSRHPTRFPSQHRDWSSGREVIRTSRPTPEPKVSFRKFLNSRTSSGMFVRVKSERDIITRLVGKIAGKRPQTRPWGVG